MWDHEIRSLYRDLLAAWNGRSADGMARLFAPGGVAVGFDGSEMVGPDAIRATLAPVFANHPTGSYVAIVRDVRLVGSDGSDGAVAILRAVTGMARTDTFQLNPDVNALQTLVASRRAGGSDAGDGAGSDGWQIELFQNTPAAFHGRPDAARALTDELRATLSDQITESLRRC